MTNYLYLIKQMGKLRFSKSHSDIPAQGRGRKGGTERQRERIIIIGLNINSGPLTI